MKDTMNTNNIITFATIGIAVLLSVFKITNNVVLITVLAILCIVFNVYNYKRLKYLQPNNKRLTFVLLFMNLPFIISVVAILVIGK